jgi:hypothetical protein
VKLTRLIDDETTTVLLQICDVVRSPQLHEWMAPNANLPHRYDCSQHLTDKIGSCTPKILQKCRATAADLETASTNAPSAQATLGDRKQLGAGSSLAILRRKLPRADLTFRMSD